MLSLIICFASPHQNCLQRLVYMRHQVDLYTFFWVVLLVNTYPVDPECASSICVPQMSKSIIQILRHCHQLIITSYLFPFGRVSPGVRDSFVVWLVF